MDPLRRKLVWLVVSRAAILGALFVITILLGRESPFAWPVSLLALIVSALSFIYAVALRLNLSPLFLIALQLGNDALLVTWLVYRTGDVQSPFSALYLVVVFAASLLSSRRGIVVITLVTVLLYSALTGAILAGTLPRMAGAPPYAMEALPQLQFNFAFTLVAILAVSTLSFALSDLQRKSEFDLAAATRRLAALRAFNERVIESMRSGLLTADLEGRVITFNRAAEEITGWAAAEAQDKAFGDLFPEVARLLEESGGPEAGPRQYWLRGDNILTRADGSGVHLGFNIAPLTSEDGEVRGFVFIFQDVTEIFELEQEVRRQEKLAALGTMAAGLAHEIRNPLASMRGSIQVLAIELKLDEDQKRLMQIVLRESDRLNRTVTDFLSYARNAPVAPSEFDLKRSVADAVVLLRNSPELGPGHEIVEAYPEDEVRVFADQNQIRQVFWNLARNGLQAMPQGGRLTVKLEPAAAGSCLLTIEDEGVGMTDEQLATLFEPFTPSATQGSGLGMAIVYRLVQNHGGRITVDSKPGSGTRAQVWLPAGGPEPARPVGTVSPAATEP